MFDCRPTPLLLLALCLLIPATREGGPLHAAEEPARLELIAHEDGEGVSLFDHGLDVAWSARPDELFGLDAHPDVDAEVKLSRLDAATVELRMTLTNRGDVAREAAVTFPRLRALGGPSVGDPSYCYPRRPLIIGDRPVHLRLPYSGIFPFQFMGVQRDGGGGLYLMTCDTEAHEKTYGLRKNGTGDRARVELGVEWKPRSLAPGETWRLPAARIGVYDGDWHGALDAYRRWLATWQQPQGPRPRWFREVFNFRQVFLHFALPTPSGAFDPKTQELRLLESVQQDAKAFGGVDYVHLFDWGWTPTGGRVGDYAPWAYLGGSDALRRQIAELRDAGIPTGLYLEGYLADANTAIGLQHGEAWQMRDAEGKPHQRYAPSLHMCPHVEEWRDHLAATARRAVQQTGAQGVYLDQLGFTNQYRCFSDLHGHPPGVSVLRGETQLLSQVRAALPGDVVLYTEETPVDVNVPYLDGSFTYAMSVDDGLSPARVNLSRFVWTDFKTFEIIRCDAPLGDDVDAVWRIFFNGEGIWLEGEEDAWFSPRVLTAIRTTHRILRAHRDAFVSTDVRPLVPTLHDGLYANRFTGSKHTVWTLLNSTDDRIEGAVLRERHCPGATYHDAISGKPLETKHQDGETVLSVSLPPGAVGCIVRSLQTKHTPYKTRRSPGTRADISPRLPWERRNSLCQSRLHGAGSTDRP